MKKVIHFNFIIIICDGWMQSADVKPGITRRPRFNYRPRTND